MKYKRKSIRLKEYDYSSEGYYFVTVCVAGMWEMFWDVGAIPCNRPNEKGEKKISQKGENMVSPVRMPIYKLNDIGEMINKWWQKVFEKYHHEIEIDEYVIMPNHIHGIIKIVGANPRIRPNRLVIKNTYAGIGRYISWFKRMSTNEYIRHIRSDNWKPFNERFWHRNYYEHIIRNERSLNKIREYIRDNPAKWQYDKYNPNGVS